jgi:hypothetical protein
LRPFITFNLLIVLYEVQLSNLSKLLGFSFKVRTSAASAHEDGMKGVKKGDESLRRRCGGQLIRQRAA